MNLLKKAIAECLGTFVLVFFACGVAALTGAVMAAIGIGAGILVSHLQTKSNAKRKEDT